MHIGLVIYGSLDGHSGGFLYDRLVVDRLRASGEQVSVIELPWRSYQRSLLDNLDEALAFKLASGSWEVLVEDELAHPSLVRTNRRVQQLSRGRFPIISLVHLLRSSSQPWSGWRGWLYQQVERQYLRTVDGCIYVSRYIQQASQALSGSAPPAVVAYPAGDHLDPGGQPPALREPARLAGRLQILFLGSVVPRKSLHTLLAALQQLGDLDWRLQVAGSLQEDGDYARQMQALAAQPPLAGRVSFLGLLPAAQVAGQLADSHVLVLPSHAEGYPIACLEAMAYAVPVITTAASGAVELVQPGENGFLLPPGEHQQLEGYLRKLAVDIPLRQRLSRSAWNTYQAHPTWQDTAVCIRNFLLERIEARQAAARQKQFFSTPEG